MVAPGSASASHLSLPPVARFEENQSGAAEMEEFLPHGAEKKQTHFTDVSIGMGTAVAAGRGQLPVSPARPLPIVSRVRSSKGRRLLGCPSST